MPGSIEGSAQLLDSGGPFESVLPGFAPRQEQLQLAVAIEKTIASGGTLVAEAGTGIGKTLSYLVPVLRGSERTIISTGTKTLQDQLYFRDLPLVKKALGSTLKTALLKGRANYLCLYRMEQARKDGRLPSRESITELEAIRQWAPSSIDGDLSISSVIAEDSELWPMVTSTADNCLGSDCPDFEACFVARARSEAQAADVVVVNHHLLFADMAIKHSGFGEVLPGASVFIVDEAHQAPETASQFFSSSLSTRQISDLCRDLLAEAAETSGGMAVVRDEVAHCRQVIREFQLACHDNLEDRGTWDEMLNRSEIRNVLQSLDTAVAGLNPVAETLQGASRGMDACLQRLAEIQAHFDHLDKPVPDTEVRWFERRGQGVSIHTTPLDISSLFSSFCEQLDAAWVFTSATLSVNGGFDHFVRQLGLHDADTLNLDSPFDYEKNALMWLPVGLPEPREPSFVPELLQQVRPVLKASKGRAFMLFTSHRALKQAAELLAGTIDHPLFVQGEMPRSMLLEAFRESGDGILLGSASFWGGVDVMGDALSLVIIDKLPFAPPNDPVMVARSNQLRQHGGNPFMELFLPQAVIALKQGAGRLIRDVNDRGVLVICDRRLVSKGYGSVFLESLPPMQQTPDRDRVVEFLKMNLLAIETSTETCSVAISVDGEVLERYQHAPRLHAELLLPWVEQLLAEAGIGFSSIDAIAFSRGPGSFTSLRIGIGVVQGLAWASDRPVIPVSSLAATAQTASNEGIDAALVALDARMNEVFTGTFEVNSKGLMVPVTAEKVCAPEDVEVPKHSETYGIGNGFDRYPALGEISAHLLGIRSDIWPKASSMLQLAQDWLNTHKPLSAEQAQPVYLRDNVAKKEKDR